MILEILLLILTLFTITLLTGNNIGTIRGPFKSLGEIRKLSTITILFGVLIGVIAEGWKLNRFYTAYQLSGIEVLILLISTTFLVLIGNIYRTPISLNMSIISGVWGINLAASNNFDIEYTLLIIAAWITLPLISIVSSAAISHIITRKNLLRGWGGYSIEKIISIISTLFLAYVFGANTIGLIISIVSPNLRIFYGDIILLLGITASYLIGMKYLSGSLEAGLAFNIYNIGLVSLISSQISTFIMLEIATQFGLPISLTQVFTISLIGASLSRRLKLINIRYIIHMSKVWITSLILGFTISITLYILLNLLTINYPVLLTR